MYPKPSPYATPKAARKWRWATLRERRRRSCRDRAEGNISAGFGAMAKLAESGEVARRRAVSVSGSEDVSSVARRAFAAPRRF
jgi:hypothetical protein